MPQNAESSLWLVVSLTTLKAASAALRPSSSSLDNQPLRAVLYLPRVRSRLVGNVDRISETSGSSLLCQARQARQGSPKYQDRAGNGVRGFNGSVAGSDVTSEPSLSWVPGG